MNSTSKLAKKKDAQIVQFNVKQQKLLQESLHGIRLQESYAAKLLSLGDREVKLRQANLNLRVSRVRSHLKPEDVAEMRRDELQGKTKTFHQVNSNSKSRIAAAARRLKLDPDGLSHRFSPAQEFGGGVCSPKPRCEQMERVQSSASYEYHKSRDEPRSLTPYSKIQSKSLQNSARSQRPTTAPVFSCHDPMDGEKKRRSESAGALRDPRRLVESSAESRSLSCLSRRSTHFFDSLKKLENNERLQRALYAQRIVTADVERRTGEMLKKIDLWVAENHEEEEEDLVPSVQPRLTRNRSRNESKRLDYWRDIKKCRYLRIPDDRIDFSGLNTLVKDQLALRLTQ